MPPECAGAGSALPAVGVVRTGVVREARQDADDVARRASDALVEVPRLRRGDRIKLTASPNPVARWRARMPGELGLLDKRAAASPSSSSLRSALSPPDAPTPLAPPRGSARDPRLRVPVQHHHGPSHSSGTSK